ncbi:MAG: long-chain fatty acid--CoA ligase [Alphaproteobacteria bacterium]|nr:long-chain fatty acid--CoA ligase [Alphaproteobacteria bacterium]
MTDTPWLTSYPREVNWQAKIVPQALPALLEEPLAHYPDRVAVDFLGYTLTYRALGQRIDRAAKGFQRAGVKKGVHVGIFLPNCPQFIIAYYGILKAGGTVVNCSPLYSVRELKHQLEDAGVRMVVTLDLAALYPKIAELLADKVLDTVVVSRFAGVLPFPKNLLFPLLKRKDVSRIPHDAHHVSFEKLCDNDGRYAPVPIDPERDIAVLQSTGGTTGVPKGAMLTHANCYVNALQSALWFDTLLKAGQERMMGVLPFFHVFAMTAVMNLGLYRGMTIILHPRFELLSVLQDIQRKKPTVMPGVPTMYAAINNFAHVKDYDLSSIRACISGGAPLPVEVKAQFEKLTGCTLVEGYGLTESSPVAAVNPLTGKNKAGSIGLPLPDTIFEVMHMDDKVTPMPLGEIGEICIRGPQVMRGYWNKPEETRAALREGRLHTGDLGFIDEEGYIHIVDRQKEMIISGGFNVYPRNVEEALYLHPEVAECAVLGVADATYGQRVKAFVVRKAGSTLTREALHAFLQDNVAKYAVPKEIEFRDTLPKSPIGKILKKELQ